MEDGVRTRRTTRNTSRRKLNSTADHQPGSSARTAAPAALSRRQQHSSPPPSGSRPALSSSRSATPNHLLSKPLSVNNHKKAMPKRIAPAAAAGRGGASEREWDARNAEEHIEEREESSGLAGDRLNIALLLFLYSLQGVPLGAFCVLTSVSYPLNCSYT